MAFIVHSLNVRGLLAYTFLEVQMSAQLVCVNRREGHGFCTSARFDGWFCVQSPENINWEFMQTRTAKLAREAGAFDLLPHPCATCTSPGWRLGNPSSFLLPFCGFPLGSSRMKIVRAPQPSPFDAADSGADQNGRVGARPFAFGGAVPREYAIPVETALFFRSSTVGPTITAVRTPNARTRPTTRKFLKNFRHVLSLWTDCCQHSRCQGNDEMKCRTSPYF